MTRSLGAASSNLPSRDETPEHDRATVSTMAMKRGDGEAAPNNWVTIWRTLADRLVEWQEACEAEDATLVFDSHDQARLA